MNALCDALRDAVDSHHAPARRGVARLAAALAPGLLRHGSPPLLTLRGLTLEIDTPAGVIRPVRDVSLDLRAGETLAIVGESGSGKTTLLNILGCIDSVSRGELEIGGVCVGNASSSRRRIIRRDRVGIVHQSFALLPTLTASENVMIPLHLQGKPRLEASLRVQSVLEQVDMLEKADMFPRHLSGGQLQRVAIARSIVHSPMVVLADEPTGNLDSRNSVAIMKLLRAIAETGCAIVCATHDQEVVSRCDRVLQTKTGASRATRFALG